MVQVVLTPTMLFLSILGGFRAPHTLIFLRRRMLSFFRRGGLLWVLESTEVPRTTDTTQTISGFG